ncbi:unnamed protein product [Periconia digitata]|uniref:Uncharacterized protein n=1 Tax=Periconia digitata TaxID=1303443 RepID=A0A9W4U932_9PLEO|nr:unnamed protein product [Periconia digitata]
MTTSNHDESNTSGHTYGNMNATSDQSQTTMTTNTNNNDATQSTPNHPPAQKYPANDRRSKKNKSRRYVPFAIPEDYEELEDSEESEAEGHQLDEKANKSPPDQPGPEQAHQTQDDSENSQDNMEEGEKPQDPTSIETYLDTDPIEKSEPYDPTSNTLFPELTSAWGWNGSSNKHTRIPYNTIAFKPTNGIRLPPRIESNSKSGNEDEKPQKTTTLFGKDNPPTHERYRPSLWSRALRMDWRLSQSNSGDPASSNKNVKMNHGIIRTPKFVATCEDVEIGINRRNESRVIQLKPRLERVHIPESIQEESLARPSNYGKKILPFSEDLLDHQFYDKIKPEQKEDAAYMNWVAQKLSASLKTSVGNYRDVHWSYEKVLESMRNDKLQYENESIANADLHRQIAELKTELNQKDHTIAALKETRESDLKELHKEFDRERSNFAGMFGAIDSNIRNKRKEIPELSNELTEMQNTTKKVQEGMEIILNVQEQILSRRWEYTQRLETELREIKRDTEASIKQAYLYIAQNTGDAKIARLNHRKGLIEGRYLATSNKTIRQAYVVSSESVRAHYNGEIAKVYKTILSEIEESVGVGSLLRGILYGVNFEKSMQADNYTSPQWDRKVIDVLAWGIGKLARSYYKQGQLKEHMPDIFKKGSPSCILHPEHGIDGGKKDPESFHGIMLRAFNDKTNEEIVPPIPTLGELLLQPLYDPEQLEKIIEAVSLKEEECYAAGR